MTRLRLNLLGPFEARTDDGDAVSIRAKKSRALLALLASPSGRPRSRDELAALLWGGMADAQARANLRQSLFQIRGDLGAAAAALRVDDESVALDRSVVDVDADTFAALVEERTSESLERAAELYRGELLEGLAVEEEGFEQWLAESRTRLRELALQALASLTRYQRRRQDREAAIRTALRSLALDPLQEDMHRALIRLYGESDRRGAALRQYQECVAVLRRELGTEPDAATQALYRTLLTQRAVSEARVAPALEPARAAGTAPRSPDWRYAETAVVGREAELARLRAALGRAAVGVAGVVAVVGEAGIGKSRLVEELAAGAADATVLIGRAHENEQILPFGVWVDALRAARLPEQPEVVDAVGAPWRGELARLLPELAGSEPKPPASLPDYQRLFESVLAVLVVLAERRTLLVILEDLHWADEMSQRLLAFVARRLQSQRVLLVGTLREEEIEGAPILKRCLEDFAGNEQFAALRLARLSRDDTAALVRMLLPGGDRHAPLEPFTEGVWNATEGNPFMVVETTHSVQRAPESGHVALPDRVRETLGRRLTALSDQARSLVATASAIGRQFDFELVRRAADLEDDAAGEAAEELVRRHVLTAVGERFDFTHDRLREVAYTGLPAWRRKRMHARIAAALEALHASDLESQCETLAVHHRASEAWNEAALHLHRAGNRAVARAAYRAAATYFDQAIAALDRLPQEAGHAERAMDLRLDLRNALVPLGETARIEERLREAEAIARTAGDRMRLGWISSYMSAVHWRRGTYETAVTLGRRALALAEALSDEALAVETNLYLGMAHYSLGEHDLALATLGRNLGSGRSEVRGHPGFVLHAATSRLFSVLCYVERGQLANGRALGEEAVRIAEAADEPFFLAVALMSTGELELSAGRLDAAVAALERALALCERSDIPFGFPWVAGALGYAYALAGAPERGAAMLEQALAHASAVGLAAREALYLARLAVCEMRRGRTDEAAALCERALSLARERRERGVEAFAAPLRTEIANGDTASAARV
jgi:DNA-binding SARP family transcriptional activator